MVVRPVEYREVHNVTFERLDRGLYAVFQEETDGVQSVILTEANILDLWVLVRQYPSEDEGAEAVELFQEALEGLDNLKLVPANSNEKEPPRSRVGLGGFVRSVVGRLRRS